MHSRQLTSKTMVIDTQAQKCGPLGFTTKGNTNTTRLKRQVGIWRSLSAENILGLYQELPMPEYCRRGTKKR